MPSVNRSAALDAFRTAQELATSPEVADAWDDESSCAGMSVGGLVHHLLSQPVHVATGLDADPVPDPIPLLEHYARADWVTADHDDEVNVSVRTKSNEAGEQGLEAILAVTAPAIDRLPGLLAAAREPDTIFIPWQGWSMTTDDFLITRLMETVVHSDDLASSVGLETPEFPDPVIPPVLGLLTGVAVRRHGQAALVRALSRPQRSDGPVSAF
jgi:hypothetical protein